MVAHVLDSLSELEVERAVVVVGHGADMVTTAVLEDAPTKLAVEFVEQRVQRGTGDALAVALTVVPEGDIDDDEIVVLPGDTPLLRPATLSALVATHRAAGAAASLLTARLSNPRGYGRVVREQDGRVARIVEEADATADELAIDEVNTSIYCFRRGLLAPALRRLRPENAQGEYYLTDVVKVLRDAGYPVVSVVADDPLETAGVNDRAQLAVAEAELRRRVNDYWMRSGVTMADPANTYVDAAVQLASDVTILPGTVLQGATHVGRGAVVGPTTHLVDCVVGDEAVVEQTAAKGAEIGAHARVGPFAVLTPGSRLMPGTVTGPFYKSAEA
jgi:bifunctional UDP-N-acetylglucosamine pyrophosphorylase/glucosamine-1-phosphate N-acetyltransferase